MDKKQKALEKINAIRNSIIGGQTINWSEHIYPLVAALKEAGIEGMDYPEARENFGTTLQRAVAAEGMAARLWSLLDDIDTLDDSCKSFDTAFRKKTYQVQQNRHEMIRSDGQHLYRLDTGMRIDDEGQLAAAPKNPLEREVLTITYRNHRDEIAERHIIPQRVWFGTTEWYPDPQWLLSAWDKDREVERDFAMKRMLILSPEVEEIQDQQLKQIADDHAVEVEKLLSGHYTAQKTPAKCIAALTEDALAKAGAIWEKRLAELEADGARLAEQGKALEDQLKNRN